MKWLRGKQKGFTLVELLVAIPIIAVVAAAVAGITIQTLRSNRISADTLAVRYAQQAGDWVSKDGIQAQSATGVSTGVGSGIPFTLKWSFWDTGTSPPVNDTHTVSYSLQDTPSSSLKRLVRCEVVTDKDGIETKNTTITVAEGVDSSATTCRWQDSGQKTFIFTVTIVVGQETQTRSYQISPRPMA